MSNESSERICPGCGVSYGQRNPADFCDHRCPTTAEADAQREPELIRIHIGANEGKERASSLLKYGGTLTSWDAADALFDLLGGYDTMRTDVVFVRDDGKEFNAKTMCAAIGQKVHFWARESSESDTRSRPTVAEMRFQPAPETEASRNDPEELRCVACGNPVWAHSYNRTNARR